MIKFYFLFAGEDYWVVLVKPNRPPVILVTTLIERASPGAMHSLCVTLAPTLTKEFDVDEQYYSRDIYRQLLHTLVEWFDIPGYGHIEEHLNAVGKTKVLERLLTTQPDLIPA